jgi:nucleotide-binding universal stress UspA family protein
MNRKPIESILAGVDAGAVAPAQLERLRHLRAGNPQARLHLVHVVDSRQVDALSVAPAERRAFIERLVAAAAPALQTIAADLQGDGGAEVGSDVLAGVPADRILEAAAGVAAELVVVSAGRSAWRRPLLGSTARALAHAATLPLLLVADRAAQPYRSVLSGYLADDGARAALRLAQRLAPDARIAVLHVVDTRALTLPGLVAGDGAWREQLRSQARSEAAARLAGPLAQDAADRPVQLTIELGHPAGVLMDAVHASAPDLLALGRGHEGPVARLMLGSVSDTLAQMTTGDLLLVPA